MTAGPAILKASPGSTKMPDPIIAPIEIVRTAYSPSDRRKAAVGGLGVSWSSFAKLLRKLVESAGLRCQIFVAGCHAGLGDHDPTVCEATLTYRYPADMEVIRRHHMPELRRPIAIIAFGGWNDACDVASTSADFVVDAHSDSDVFAEIEPDAIYDFQQHRPSITIDDGVAHKLRWPTIRFTALNRPWNRSSLPAHTLEL